MSKRENPTTKSSTFNEHWYKVALENHAAQFERDFEKAFLVPEDVTWIGAPGFLFPAIAQAENALVSFGRYLLSDCLEILQTFNGQAASEFIRGQLGPRLLEEIRNRKKQIRERPCLTGWDADDVRMLLAVSRIDQLENELENVFEIEAYRREADETKKAVSPSSGPIIALPQTWDEVRRRGSISQKEAAQWLGKKSAKTIQRRLEDRRLTRTPNGRIECNDLLRIELRKVHGKHVLR